MKIKQNRYIGGVSKPNGYCYNILQNFDLHSNNIFGKNIGVGRYYNRVTMNRFQLQLGLNSVYGIYITYNDANGLIKFNYKL